MNRDLGLRELRLVNVRRCTVAFFPHESKSPCEYATALAGEIGEACDAIYKRTSRGDDGVTLEHIGDELADALTYLDLLAARLGIDLADAVVRKFNKVSDRRGVDIKLTPVDPVPLRWPADKYGDCTQCGGKSHAGAC